MRPSSSALRNTQERRNHHSKSFPSYPTARIIPCDPHPPTRLSFPATRKLCRRLPHPDLGQRRGAHLAGPPPRLAQPPPGALRRRRMRQNPPAARIRRPSSRHPAARRGRAAPCGPARSRRARRRRRRHRPRTRSPAAPPERRRRSAHPRAARRPHPAGTLAHTPAGPDQPPARHHRGRPRPTGRRPAARPARPPARRAAASRWTPAVHDYLLARLPRHGAALREAACRLDRPRSHRAAPSPAPWQRRCWPAWGPKTGRIAAEASPGPPTLL